MPESYQPAAGGEATGTRQSLHRSCALVAIVGGSGSGKSRLTEKLVKALGAKAARLSLDDFYLDRSPLAPARRAAINFDHPRAIDWPRFERVLRACLAGRTARVPCYDFKTHCRLPRASILQPNPIILVDGLWLWRRPGLRRLFTMRIFLNCSIRTRLKRRMARDRRLRGRTPASVKAQFWKTVEPMHRRFVEPQKRWADLVLPENWGERQVRAIAARLRGYFPAPRIAARRSS